VTIKQWISLATWTSFVWNRCLGRIKQNLPTELLTLLKLYFAEDESSCRSRNDGLQGFIQKYSLCVLILSSETIARCHYTGDTGTLCKEVVVVKGLSICSCILRCKQASLMPARSYRGRKRGEAA